MPVRFDFVYIAVITAAWAAYDYFVEWPGFLRRVREQPHRARIQEYWRVIVQQWAVVAVGAALWGSYARPWAALGLRIPDGFRLWTSIALTAGLALLFASNALAVSRSASARERVQRQIGTFEALLQHSAGEF